MGRVLFSIVNLLEYSLIKKRMTITLFFLLLSGAAFAGITGKIKGKIVDENGEPLPGANVILEGTNRGAATDKDGEYILLSIDAGTYAITVNVIGYSAITKTNVIVHPDRTTILNFNLTQEAIGMDAVKVYAEKPLVELDRTFSEYSITSEDINRSVMVKSVSDIISLAPGMDIHGSGRIRGGDMNSISADVVYYVDGVKMVSNDGLSLNNYTGVGKYDIESISIITGGLSAEYGNAQAGVVNIVTRQGEDTFHGNFEVTNQLPGNHHWGPDYYQSAVHRGHMDWDNPEWVNETDSLTGEKIHTIIPYWENSGQAYQWNLSGPIIKKKISFYTGGRINRLANYGISPLSHATDNFEGTWKLSFNMFPKISMKIGGVYSTSWGFNSGAGVGGIKGMGDSGKNVFLPANRSSAGKTENINHMEYFALNHLITPKTFYELRISSSSTSQTPFDLPDSTTDIRKDKEGWFNLPRDVISFKEGVRNRLGIKFDFSSQVTNNHLIKTGFDYTNFNVWSLEYGDFNNNRRLLYIGKDHSVKAPINPSQFAWYIQDKMEYKGLVLNAGVRMDRFDPNTSWPITNAMTASDYFMNSFTRFDLDSLNQSGLIKKMKAKTAWSPRIGVAHPITDKSMIHFFYGHIYQVASFYTLFTEAWDNYGQKDEDLNGDGEISSIEQYNRLEDDFFGYPDLEFEKTISFELGLDWNFYRDYVLSASTFYKSSNNQVSSPGAVQLQWWDPAKQMFDFQFTHRAGNGIHEDIQGFEFSLQKRFKDHFGFNVAYNLQWAKQGAAGAGSQFWVPDSAFVMDKKWWMGYKTNEDGSESPTGIFSFLRKSYAIKANQFIDSLKTLGLDLNEYGNTGLYYVEFWDGTEEEPKPDSDIRSYAKAQVYASTPQNFGPMGLLGDLTFNLVYRMTTGNAFEYSPIGKPLEWRHRPMVTRTDLSIEKQVLGKKSMRATFFIEIENLFNQKDVTSSPSEFIRWGLEKPQPDNKEYLEYGDPGLNSRYYGRPREIRFGIRSSF